MTTRLAGDSTLFLPFNRATIVDAFFGPVVFGGVLTDGDLVEIVDFAHDPDYWQLLDESTGT
jgi:hypothetical protein